MRHQWKEESINHNIKAIFSKLVFLFSLNGPWNMDFFLCSQIHEANSKEHNFVMPEQMVTDGAPMGRGER